MMSPQTKVLLAIAILSVAPDESAGKFSTMYAQEENIHTLSTDSKINALIDMVNTTNTRLDIITTSQANAQARFDQLEASIKVLGELVKNASIASQQEKTIYIPFTHSTKNWYDAFTDCSERGMNLASIENEEEYHKVMKKVTSIGERPDRVDFWISGKRYGNEGRFQWVSNGHTVTYNQWQTGEPDGDGTCPGGDLERCIEINQRMNNKWNDYCCSHRQYYICQNTI